MNTDNLLSNLTIRQFTKENVGETPETPGIYIFFNSQNVPIYVGKSVELKNRLRSYLSFPLSPKTEKMVSEARGFATIEVLSELEALLLEAKLIRIFKPLYNIELKDDKNPLYIRITKEKYPKVLYVRKIDEDKKVNKSLAFYGPFPSSANAKAVVKMIRRVFPFSQHDLGKRKCLYAQIGLCFPCPNEIEAETDESKKAILKKKYWRNIRMVKRILDGNFEKVQKDLQKHMEKYAKSEEFEKADEVKTRLEKLEYVTRPFFRPSDYMANPNLKEDVKQAELNDLKNILSPYFYIESFSRIEAYDIAHLQGSNPTASMVTFIDAEPDKNFYRRFRIDPKRGGDDVSSMSEVAKRRYKHLGDWGRPDLIIVDGGKTQSSVFNDIFRLSDIPVVGLAKRYETIVIPKRHKGDAFVEIRLPKCPARNLVQRIRDEAHRFARTYHHHLLRKGMFNS